MTSQAWRPRATTVGRLQAFALMAGFVAVVSLAGYRKPEEAAEKPVEVDEQVLQQQEAERRGSSRRKASTLCSRKLKDPPVGSEAEYARRLEELASGLCTTVFVRNAGEFAGKLI